MSELLQWQKLILCGKAKGTLLLGSFFWNSKISDTTKRVPEMRKLLTFDPIRHSISSSTDNSLSCSLFNSTPSINTGAWETHRRIFPKSQALVWVTIPGDWNLQNRVIAGQIFNSPNAFIPDGKTAFAGAKPERTLGSGSNDVNLIKKEVCERENKRENLERDGGVGAQVFELGMQPGRHRRRRGRLPHRHQRHQPPQQQRRQQANNKNYNEN